MPPLFGDVGRQPSQGCFPLFRPYFLERHIQGDNTRYDLKNLSDGPENGPQTSPPPFGGVSTYSPYYRLKPDRKKRFLPHPTLYHNKFLTIYRDQTIYNITYQPTAISVYRNRNNSSLLTDN
jgi:hypothetical protein